MRCCVVGEVARLHAGSGILLDPLNGGHCLQELGCQGLEVRLVRDGNVECRSEVVESRVHHDRVAEDLGVGNVDPLSIRSLEDGAPVADLDDDAPVPGRLDPIALAEGGTCRQHQPGGRALDQWPRHQHANDQHDRKDNPDPTDIDPQQAQGPRQSDEEHDPTRRAAAKVRDLVGHVRDPPQTPNREPSDERPDRDRQNQHGDRCDDVPPRQLGTGHGIFELVDDARLVR